MDKDMAFELIRGFAHVNRFLRPQCAPFHLRKSELMALGCVCYAHGHRKKALSPSEIGEILGISRPAITAILNTLEEKELILRTMDHLDKRRILVELSQKGRAGLEEVENEMLKRVGQIMQALGEEQSEQLRSLLNKALEVEQTYHKQQERGVVKCEES